jgi:hypothetical protein
MSGLLLSYISRMEANKWMLESVKVFSKGRSGVDETKDIVGDLLGLGAPDTVIEVAGLLCEVLNNIFLVLLDVDVLPLQEVLKEWNNRLGHVLESLISQLHTVLVRVLQIDLGVHLLGHPFNDLLHVIEDHLGYLPNDLYVVLMRLNINLLVVRVEEALPYVVEQCPLQGPEIIAGFEDGVGIFKSEQLGLTLLLCLVTLTFAT